MKKNQTNGKTLLPVDKKRAGRGVVRKSLSPVLPAALPAAVFLFILALPSWGRTQRGGDKVWTLRGIKPAQGPWGTVVTIEGTGFIKDVKVFYDEKPLTPIAMGRNFVRVRVPEGARSGWFTVSQHDRKLTAPERFIVINPPAVEKLVPDESLPNTWITLKGAHLEPKMRFWIGGEPVRRQFVGSGEMRLFVHRGLKSGPLVYEWQGRKHRTKHFYTMTELPRTEGFRPESGWYGDEVIIKGEHFCRNPKVTLGGKKTALAKKPEREELRVLVPEGAESGRFEIECHKMSFEVPGVFNVTPTFARLKRIKPMSGPPGRWITIYGEGFRPKDSFWLGRTRLETKFVSPKTVRVRIAPEAETGKLFYESFGKRFSSNDQIVVHRQPTISGISPESGWYGDEVELRGENFCPDMKVEIAGRNIPVVNRTGSTLVTVQIPKKVKSGKLRVTCFKWSVHSPSVFKLEPPGSSVFSAQPLKGPPGTKMVLKGKMLTKADSFYLGELRMPMKFRTPTEVELEVPPGAESGPIIHKSYGRSNRTKFVFNVAIPRPIVASFVPRHAWFGDTVSLRGRNICPKPEVFLRNEKLEILEASPGEVKVRIPRGAKSGNLVVVCPRHKVMVRPALAIKPPFGRILSINPTSGPWGTWVTVEGESLSKDDVFFLGRRRLKSKFISSNRVSVQIPEKAESGSMEILSAGKRRVSDQEFEIVFLTPVVKNFTPRSGWYGDTVTLHGRHFCMNPRVVFTGGNVTAEVNRRSNGNTLEVTVPEGAQTGALAVECHGRMSRSSRFFVLSPPLAHVSGVKPDRGPWETWISVTGRNFTKDTIFYLGETKLKMSYKSPESVRVFIPRGAKSGLIYVESFGQRRDTSYTYVVRKPAKD